MAIPANLALQLVEDALPWRKATQLDIIAFLQRYTLHDSYWIGLYTECAWRDTSVAIIRFDPVWNSSVSAPTSFVADWPWLFLRFSCVTSINLAGFSNIDGTQRGISTVTADLLADEEVVSVIGDHYGGSVTLRHFPLVDVLVLDKGGSVIEFTAKAIS